MTLRTSDTLIVYDGECPVCTRMFAVHTRFRHNVGDTRLINARVAPVLIRYLHESENIDIDSDFAVRYGNRWYAGGAALGVLYAGSIKPRAIRRICFAVLRVTYPVLRFGRLALLGLLGRRRIRLVSSPSRQRNENDYAE